MDDITVLVFGPLRERVGVAEVHVDGATVQEVWDELVRLHPAAAVDARTVRAARNLGYCAWDTEVRDGDTIAFIPPVAGGSDDPSPVRVLGNRRSHRHSIGDRERGDLARRRGRDLHRQGARPQ